MNEKKITGIHYKNHNFTDETIEGVTFFDCTFEKCMFTQQNLKGVKFEVCKGNYVSFRGADLTDSTFDKGFFINSDFTDANFQSANLRATRFTGSLFIGCRFDYAQINSIDISRCNLHLSSFENTKIDKIIFLPARSIPKLRGLNFFKQRDLQANNISINGNKFSDFYDYCVSERRKDRFFKRVNESPAGIRQLAIIFLILFGFFTDYGQSFKRWSYCTMAMILFYAAIDSIKNCISFTDTLIKSIRCFFAFNAIEGNMEWFYLSESIVGYFMLGALISLLTAKLSLD